MNAKPIRKQISVPLTIHDVTVGEIDAEWLDAHRISIVDIHLSRIEAEKLIKMIQKRLDNAIIGTVGIRFTGRMVL